MLRHCLQYLRLKRIIIRVALIPANVTNYGKTVGKAMVLALRNLMIDALGDFVEKPPAVTFKT